MISKIICLFCVFGRVFSISDTFELTDEEYYQLPDLFDLENYEKCLSQRQNAFCGGTFELTAPGPSEMYDVLKKFSMNKQIHFNHTKIHRAICLGPKSNCPIKGDLMDSFEQCIDQRMSEEYGLNAKLLKFYFCRRSGEKLEMDGTSKKFIVFLIVVILLNVTGTVYDIFIKDSNSKGNRWLMALSLSRNWEKLISPSTMIDARFQKLSTLYGVKAILTVVIHFGHVAGITIRSFPVNSRFMDKLYQHPFKDLFYNSTLMLQIFISLTNTMFAYKLLVFSEKYNLSFKILPLLILDRIARIQPMQLVAIGIVANIAPHLSDGPYWYKNVVGEAKVYRDTWWRNALFVNNFFEPEGTSLMQTWYLAADFQLYVIACVVMLWIIKRGLDPEYVLKRLLLVSLLVVFSLIFILELEPDHKIIAPENIANIFAGDRSFKLLYQSFWGSLPTAIIGMLTASIYYRLERQKVDLATNKMFAVVAYSMELIMWGWLFGTCLLPLDTSKLVKTLFATFNKPVFATIVALIAIGSLFEIKGFLVKIMIWPGWRVLSRLSLGSFLIQFVVMKLIIESRIYSTTMSFTSIIADSLAVSTLSYVMGFPLTMLVEYPAVELYKVITNYGSADRINKFTKIK